MNAPVVKEPRAPFPYFGGKRMAAQDVWNALGDAGHYIEPFCGSCAVLLARPKSHRGRVETVNDADGMLVNVWRSIRHYPDLVAEECAIPVMEAELHARLWAVRRKRTRDFLAWLEGNEWHCDPKLAADWLYCTCASIGDCWGDSGPWHVVGGKMVNAPAAARGFDCACYTPPGIARELPHLGDAGRGINRELPAVGGSAGASGRLGNLMQYLRALADRLERVRICCGDWRRVVASPSVLYAGQRTAAVFLDPPYSVSPGLYAVGASVSEDVREWCAAAPEDVRIALCGYGNDHDALLERGWSKVEGTAGGSGYGKVGAKERERMWLSPACRRETTLF